MTTTTEQQTDLRQALETMMRDAGKTEAEISKALDGYDRSIAVSNRIEAAGLKVSYRKHLLRVSRVTFRQGRLHDGICHYQHQVTVTGRTYDLKDDLKAAGFRWDAADKLWQRPMTTKGASIHDHLEAARAELVSILDE